MPRLKGRLRTVAPPAASDRGGLVGRAVVDDDDIGPGDLPVQTVEDLRKGGRLVEGGHDDEGADGASRDPANRGDRTCGRPPPLRCLAVRAGRISSAARDVLCLLLIGAAFALPLRGLLRYQGPPMEEGFMLAFPQRVLAGDVPNRGLPAPLRARQPVGARRRVQGVRRHARHRAAVRPPAARRHRLRHLRHRPALGPPARHRLRARGPRRHHRPHRAHRAGLERGGRRSACAAWPSASPGAGGPRPGETRSADRRLLGAGLLAGLRPALPAGPRGGGRRWATAPWRGGSAVTGSSGSSAAASPPSRSTSCTWPRAGIGDAFEGMFIEPVFQLRGGPLPAPPALVGPLRRLPPEGGRRARVRRGRCRCSSDPTRCSSGSWSCRSWPLGVAAVGIWRDPAAPGAVALAGAVRGRAVRGRACSRRRSSGPTRPTSPGSAACRSRWLPLAITELVRAWRPRLPAPGDRHGRGRRVPGRWCIPFQTVRLYADLAGQSFGHDVLGASITRDGRNFYYGSAEVASAAQAVTDRLDAEARARRTPLRRPGRPAAHALQRGVLLLPVPGARRRPPATSRWTPASPTPRTPAWPTRCAPRTG